jgi:ATP-dependent Clp protease ATP-binding subunit ClpC
VIIMTSNAGTKEISSSFHLGFSSSDQPMSYEQMKKSATAEFKKLMNPELLNRIDDILVFTPLSREQVAAILDLRLTELAERVGERGLTLEVRDAAKAYLAEKGYDPAMGARPMRRIIQSEIEDEIANRLLADDFGADTVIVDYRDEKIAIELERDTELKGEEVLQLV